MLFIEIVELVQPEENSEHEGHAWIRVKNENITECEFRVDFNRDTGRFMAPWVAENRINPDSSFDRMAGYSQWQWDSE